MSEPQALIHPEPSVDSPYRATGRPPSLETLRARMNAAPMSRAQWLAVGCAFLLAAIDGFDVLSMSLVAPAVRKAWNIDFASLGLLLSSSNIGVALGYFVLAPIADLRTRRGVLLACMGVTTFSMVLCAVSQSLTQLLCFRLLVGLGIGGCTAVTTTLLAEVTNARYRPSAFAIVAIGAPVGGALGGFATAYLLAHSSWPSVFFAGALATGVLIPIFALLVPEPLALLAARRSPDRLSRVNALLVRFRLETVDTLEAAPIERRSYQVVFEREQLPTTTWAAGVMILQLLAITFTVSWLPQLMSHAGYPPSTASLTAGFLNLAGIAGGALFGVIAKPGNVKVVASAAALGFGVAIVLFGLMPVNKAALLTAAAACGFFLYAQPATFQTLVAGSFRASGRASGIGFVLGMGRIFGVAAPIIAGLLLAHGASRLVLTICFGACAIVASALILARPRPPGHAA